MRIRNLLYITAIVAAAASIGMAAPVEARPWGPPPPGWGWGPGYWGPPPHHYRHHSDRDAWVAGLIGGAAILGLGLGLSHELKQRQSPPTYYVPQPNYVPPNYGQPASPVYTPPPGANNPGNGTTMYYCPPAKAYFPTVPECPSGWVPKVFN